MEMYPLVLKPVASLKITIKPIGKSSCLSSICMGHFPLCEKSPEALLIIGFTTATGVLVMMVMIELLGLNGYDHGCKYGRRLGIWGTPKDGIWGMSTQGSFFFTTSLPMASSFDSIRIHIFWGTQIFCRVYESPGDIES